MILLLLTLLTAQTSPPSPYRSLDQANLLDCQVTDDECLGHEFAQGCGSGGSQGIGCRLGLPEWRSILPLCSVETS